MHNTLHKMVCFVQNIKASYSYMEHYTHAQNKCTQISHVSLISPSPHKNNLGSLSPISMPAPFSFTMHQQWELSMSRVLGVLLLYSLLFSRLCQDILRPHYLSPLNPQRVDLSSRDFSCVVLSPQHNPFNYCPNFYLVFLVLNSTIPISIFQIILPIVSME